MTDPIQHLRELMAKATPGYATKRISMPGEGLLEIGDPFNRPSSSRSIQLPERDAALIVAAINALPALLAVAEALSKHKASAEKYMDMSDKQKATMRGRRLGNQAEAEYHAALAALAKLDEVKQP